MNEFELAKQKGVSSPYAVGFMPYKAVAQDNLVVDYDKASKLLAQDAAMTSAPNVGIPSAYVTYLDPQIMPILFAVQNATKIFGEEKKGDWCDQSYVFPISEYTGDVTPYNDFTDNVSSDVNFEFPERQNFIFETVLKYGDREADMASKAKIAFASEKQKAAAFTIANAHNKFYLYGVAGKKIYGLLNDPNLNSTNTPISVTVSGSSYTTWADKKAHDGNNYVNDVFNDINKVWTDLCQKNGGNIDANSKIILAISNTRSPELIVPNQYGLTVRQMLKANFPNMEIVELPQLTTSSGEMLYMTVPSLMGEDTGRCTYSEKMRFSHVEAKTSYFKQKALGGTWGCIIKRTSLVATMTGI